ncbi:hypothetical protein PUW24_24035 [Paenibacillus urinalis]|uniref:Methyltransferase n=1 Tax=Paenibacillus urinalis TaxID=521520 RepID=A0AAX3MW40_9BACL|nr:MULTISPECIES: hypothetical protein [Paenibacillus]WDH81114.1 hypothetical protein PUW23_16435 [Paenibacillus urinalis]WDH97167.1 hypothetical protein PUW24_24035 [Paenibacillus urinalis]WDI00829.1 hypothetical protein PUW25_16260 [Paenibacillus urinalis]GAK39514.1 hypothetical protein TCA2_2002 [Paenibacillus sp. TCA20]
MASSFERSVKKNQQKINKDRKKRGQPSIGSGVEQEDVFKGRAFLFPFVLVVLSFMFLTLSGLTTDGVGAFDWVVFALYLGLALMYFMRRPYLKVGKKRIKTIKLSRERSMGPEDIKKIVLEKGSVVVERNGKGGPWVFSKLLNLYDVEAMGARLVQYAQNHQIPVEDKRVK